MFLVTQIEQAKATAESNKLAAEMDLIQSQRRVEAFERELQELRNGGEIPEVVRIEVDRRIEVEQKLLVAESKCSELMDKCSELMDKCNVRFLCKFVSRSFALDTYVYMYMYYILASFTGLHRKEGLLSTACACAKLLDIFSRKISYNTGFIRENILHRAI